MYIMYIYINLVVLISYAYLVNATSSRLDSSNDLRGQSLDADLVNPLLTPRDLPVGTCK